MNTPRLRFGAIIGATSIALAFIPVSAASADTSGSNVLGAVMDATPATAYDAAQVATRAGGQKVIEATVAGATVSLPSKPTSAITLKAHGSSIGITVPFSSSAKPAQVQTKGIVSYDNRNGSTTVPVVTSSGSLQINTVITSAAAPTQYSCSIAVPKGGQVISASSGYLILDGSQNAVAAVTAAWAKDANGAPVPTRYQLDGTTITQVVDFTGATAFPVVADPSFAWYGILPSVKLNRSETKTATTLTDMATACGWVTRFTSYVGGAICGLNAASIIVNTQRIYFSEKRCAQLLVGPGVIGTIGYSGGGCK